MHMFVRALAIVGTSLLIGLVDSYIRPIQISPGVTQETKKADGKEKAIFNFDDAASGTLPKGWTVAETKGAGTPATWQVDVLKDDAKQKQAMKVSTTNKENVFNILLSEKIYG